MKEAQVMEGEAKEAQAWVGLDWVVKVMVGLDRVEKAKVDLDWVVKVMGARVREAPGWVEKAKVGWDWVEWVRVGKVDLD